jgi:hypothetical protein
MTAFREHWHLGILPTMILAWRLYALIEWLIRRGPRALDAAIDPAPPSVTQKER